MVKFRIVRRMFLLLVPLHLTLLLGCPPAHRPVVIDGVEIPAGEAARITLEKARAHKQAGRLEEAGRELERIVTEFPKTEALPEALVLLGDVHYDQGHFEQAANSYARLVGEHPENAHYLHAAINMGLSLAKLGRTQEAMPTLQSVFDQMQSQEKKAEVASLLAEAYAKADQPVEATLWFAHLYQLTAVPGAQAAIKKQVTGIIDEQMSFVEVRQALEMFKDKRLQGFPADLLQFKLAKILLHILDFDRARQALEEFVARWPDHERVLEAGTLLKRLMDRHKVHPQVVGVLLPLSGQFREYGRLALEGIQLGAGIFDSGTGKDGGPILVIRDTGGDPDKALAQLEDLVYNEHAVVVLGPMVAKVAQTSAMKAEEFDIPLIALSQREQLPDIGRNVFRNFLTFDAQARQLVEYAMETLKARRFAVLYPNDLYGVGMTNAFWDEVDRRQGEIRGAEKYEQDTKDFSTPIRKLVGRYFLEARWDYYQERAKINKAGLSGINRKRAFEKLYKTLPPLVDFDVLFVPDTYEPVAMIAPALAFEDIVLKTDKRWEIERLKKSLGTEQLKMIYLFGGSGWNNPQLIEWAKRYVQGAVFCDGFFQESSRRQTQLFVSKFKANFDHAPGWIEAHAHDSAALVKHIIEVDKPASRQAFREALLKLQNFPGATGDISFSPNGEVQKDLFLLTIDGDEIKEVQVEPTPDGPTG